jgi:hypothetical protein
MLLIVFIFAFFHLSPAPFLQGHVERQVLRVEAKGERRVKQVVQKRLGHGRLAREDVNAVVSACNAKR